MASEKKNQAKSGAVQRNALGQFLPGSHPGPGPGRKPITTRERMSRAQMERFAREHAATALGALVEIATTGESEAARVTAADKLLDRGYGKAAQPITGEDGGPVQVAYDLSRLSIEQLRQLREIAQAASGAEAKS